MYLGERFGWGRWPVVKTLFEEKTWYRRARGGNAWIRTGRFEESGHDNGWYPGRSVLHEALPAGLRRRVFLHPRYRVIGRSPEEAIASGHAGGE
jgi:hypothetical protein